SSLCGACFDACPVKIDIPSLLVELRHQHTEQTGTTAEKLAMKAAAAVMKRPTLYAGAQKAAGLGRALAGRDGTISRLPPPFGGWSESRDTAAPPRQTFRAWYASAEGRATLRAAADEHDRGPDGHAPDQGEGGMRRRDGEHAPGQGEGGTE
ncbi:lactate utilization protein LutB domain-containing protein, partial [Streptomyces griseus]|uniref:lactate utilisation protein LutB domain-containing protein n=2 Tax=Streptomyces griseus group TaxID=629295 RepID=UPI0036B4D793